MNWYTVYLFEQIHSESLWQGTNYAGVAAASTIGLVIVNIEEETDRREGKGRRCSLGMELIQFHVTLPI